jgi:hypothetical protein
MGISTVLLATGARIMATIIITVARYGLMDVFFVSRQMEDCAISDPSISPTARFQMRRCSWVPMARFTFPSSAAIATPMEPLSASTPTEICQLLPHLV